MFQEQEKISSNQAYVLILAGAIGNIFTFIAVPAIKAGGRDGWLLVLLAYIIATFLGWLLIKLGLRFPDKTIIQYFPEILGTILGKLVSLIFILSFWVFTGLIYQETSDIALIFMPETPNITFIIFIAILNIYVMFKGFEVFTRVAEFLMPLAIFLILISLFFIIPEIELNNLFPILEEGFGSIMVGFPRILALAVETILFMGFWLPCLKEKNNLSKALFIGLPLGGMILTALVCITIAFAGTVLPTSILYAPLYMARYIILFDFLSGFEVIYIIVFMATSFLQIMVFFYPAVVGLAQWLNLKDYKPLIIPMAIITIIISMIPDNIMEIFILDELIGQYVVLPLGLLIPVLWLITIIKDITKKI